MPIHINGVAMSYGGKGYVALFTGLTVCTYITFLFFQLLHNMIKTQFEAQ